MCVILPLSLSLFLFLPPLPHSPPYSYLCHSSLMNKPFQQVQFTTSPHQYQVYSSVSLMCPWGDTLGCLTGSTSERAGDDGRVCSSNLLPLQLICRSYSDRGGHQLEHQYFEINCIFAISCSLTVNIGIRGGHY